jgi:multidrug efflux pump subunit AcrA (membrane-fusion protein)
VTLWSRPDRRYGARLRELAAAADPSTRTFQARFAILDADEAVAIGTTATVAVAEPESTPVARLPVAALFDQGRGASLFVVDPASGALTLVPVEVAGFEGRNVLVASGVAEGASVVVLGVQKLDPGQRVRVVESRS